MIEFFYNIKKRIIAFIKANFTIEGTYTCILPDRIYLKLLYKARIGKKLNLRHPKTYTEKLQWLKLYDRRPEYTMMVDKWAVRDYVKEKIGEEYLVPLANSGGGYYLSPDDIDFNVLPDKFVLKCNHDNGVIICKDKALLDIEKTKKELYKHLNRDYYKKGREWPYKNVPRKIYAEHFMENTDGSSVVEYKIFCFNGEPKFIQVISDRFSYNGPSFDNFDINWEYLNIYQGCHSNPKGDVYEKPSFLNKMIEISKIFSKKIPHVRVDFNVWDNRIYFGELTFFDSGGFDPFNPPEWDEKIGSWLELPEKKNRGILNKLRG